MALLLECGLSKELRIVVEDGTLYAWPVVHALSLPGHLQVHASFNLRFVWPPTCVEFHELDHDFGMQVVPRFSPFDH